MKKLVFMCTGLFMLFLGAMLTLALTSPFEREVVTLEDGQTIILDINEEYELDINDEIIVKTVYYHYTGATERRCYGLYTDHVPNDHTVYDGEGEAIYRVTYKKGKVAT